MPGRDGTGPFGQGSMTGRGLGNCTGVNAPMYGSGRSRFFGKGTIGMGFGLRCGRWNRGYYGSMDVPVDSRHPKEILAEEKGFLKNRLEAIERQLEQWKDE